MYLIFEFWNSLMFREKHKTINYLHRSLAKICGSGISAASPQLERRFFCS
jgi:hypothetical protein